MLIPNEAVYRKSLGSGLTLRTVADAAELDQVAEISAVVHEPIVGEMTRKIFRLHPHVTGRDLAFIQTEDGEAVATLCLIPWTLRLGEVELPAAELGIVGTLERHRGQGYNRILMDYFWQRFAERGAALSIIQGIPYFYRRYGYEYAMLPLEGGWRIQPDQVPAPPAEGYTLRPAEMEDIPRLARWYEQWCARLNLSACRDADTWRYLLTRTGQPEAMQHDTLILQDPGGEAAGYLRIPDYHFYENLLTVDEVSEVDFLAGMAVLDHLKKLAQERGRDGIRLHLPQSSALVRLARSLGAADLGVYSWQVSIPDRAAFLRRLGPVLEQRLAGSMFAGWTGTFGLNLYQEVIGLTFNGGKLQAVGPAGADAQTILSVPPVQFIPLVMGGRSMDEIHAAFPDAHAHRPWTELVDALFPKLSAFLATIY